MSFAAASFGHMTAREREGARKRHALRITEIERRLEIAKRIKVEADQVLADARLKLAALSVELAIKATYDASDFAETITNHFDDLLGDTFAGAVRSIEDEI